MKFPTDRPVKVVMLGAGGTGGYVAPYVFRLLHMLDRPGQKGIIIGKKGQMLKKIGTKARQDIERLLGDKVFLQLWVKVVPDWRDKSAMLKDYGYRNKDY